MHGDILLLLDCFCTANGDNPERTYPNPARRRAPRDVALPRHALHLRLRLARDPLGNRAMRAFTNDISFDPTQTHLIPPRSSGPRHCIVSPHNPRLLTF